MRIFLTGVSCVGKTTVGAKLAPLLSRPFFDLDHEIESFFSMPIERLQGKCLTMYAFRQEAAKALTHLLKREESGDAVIALSPSGLMDNYWRVVKRAKGTIVVLTDDAANILKRITFYDKDSNPIAKHVTEKEKPLYLKEIEKAVVSLSIRDEVLSAEHHKIRVSQGRQSLDCRAVPSRRCPATK